MRIIAISSLVVLLASCIKVGPASDVTVEKSPQRLTRGEYLVESVMGCVDCHSVRDFSYYAGPVIPETKGAGGELFDESIGFPGSVYSPNITPFALESWTDGEIIRAITAGVSKDGSPLFPIMPYHAFADMSEEDLFAVVAYLRTLAPVEAIHPEGKLNFPLNLLVRTMPQEKPRPKFTPKRGTAEYNKYITKMALCNDCHTPRGSKGEYITEMYMAGGDPMTIAGGVKVAPANLTPHETGLANWSKDQFIARFKAFDNDSTKYIPLAEGQPNTVMPWLYYATMSEDDLGAIFDYLQSLPAIEHQVVKYQTD